jgi:adenylate cyclase
VFFLSVQTPSVVLGCFVHFVWVAVQVGFLNGFFTIFDKLANRHKIEKIKTIGDAYVCCGGLGVDSVDPGAKGSLHHVNDMVDMALQLQAELTERNGRKKAGALDVNLRIGIHVGPVLAGIIGKR